MNENASALPDWEGLLARVRPQDHLLQLYSDEKSLAHRVGHYLREGLQRQETAIAIATPPHRAALLRALADDGIDVERALAERRLLPLDAEETLARFMVRGQPDPDRFQTVVASLLEAAPPSAGLRAFGEMVDVLWQNGNPAAALHLEHLWHRQLRRLSIPLLCAYRIGLLDRQFSEDSFQSVLAIHTHLVPAGSERLERAVTRAMEDVLGRDPVEALRPLIAAVHYPRVSMAWTEAAVLWISRALPQLSAAILARARLHQDGVPPPEPATRPEAGSDPTVLLVEDDANDRLILEHSFQRMVPGIRLCQAADGEEAIDYLSGKGASGDRKRHPLPHLVLLDLKLPRRSGLEVLEWIRETPGLEGLPVFVLSSSQERGDIDLAYALGANSYLVKEVDLQVLRKVVKGIGAYVGILSR